MNYYVYNDGFLTDQLVRYPYVPEVGISQNENLKKFSCLRKAIAWTVFKGLDCFGIFAESQSFPIITVSKGRTNTGVNIKEDVK